MSSGKLANVYFSCGRGYLEIAGFAVAMEGDVYRDPGLAKLESDDPEVEMIRTQLRDNELYGRWTTGMLRHVAEKINLRAAAMRIVEDLGERH